MVWYDLEVQRATELHNDGLFLIGGVALSLVGRRPLTGVCREDVKSDRVYWSAHCSDKILHDFLLNHTTSASIPAQMQRCEQHSPLSYALLGTKPRSSLFLSIVYQKLHIERVLEFTYQLSLGARTKYQGVNLRSYLLMVLHKPLSIVALVGCFSHVYQVAGVWEGGGKPISPVKATMWRHVPLAVMLPSQYPPHPPIREI